MDKFINSRLHTDSWFKHIFVDSKCQLRVQWLVNVTKVGYKCLGHILQ